MRRSPLLITMVAAAALLVVASGAASPTRVSGAKTIHVVEHATTDVTTDTGAAGDSVGDILTFANEVYNATNTKKVGTDNGVCVRTVAPGAYLCWWTTFLAKGQITVMGPFYDTEDSVLAITGGTGAYRNAGGEMELESRSGGTEFDFIFRIVTK